jgi:hypothetical protein
MSRDKQGQPIRTFLHARTLQKGMESSTLLVPLVRTDTTVGMGSDCLGQIPPAERTSVLHPDHEDGPGVASAWCPSRQGGNMVRVTHDTARLTSMSACLVPVLVPQPNLSPCLSWPCPGRGIRSSNHGRLRPYPTHLREGEFSNPVGSVSPEPSQMTRSGCDD